MRKIFGFLMAFSILLSACAGTPTATLLANTESSPKPIITPRSTHTPGPTKTLYPTWTPDVLTLTPKSPTPLSPLPTFTPTFDARTLATATPASKAECPKVASATNADLSFLDLSHENQENQRNAESNILDFLNRYGAKALKNAAASSQAHGIGDVILRDLTNDGEPEIAIGAIYFYIFGCQGGKYEKLLDLEPDGYLHPPSIFSVNDENRDTIPEITLLTAVFSQGGHTYQIYSWNGEKFANLLFSDDPDYPDSGDIWVEATGNIHYEDINHDFIQELILESGIPVWETYNSGLPWRNERVVYSWNGKNYLPSHWEFAKPEFRFQAVQDADLAVTQDEYAKAMDLYQQGIFSDKLRDYSPEIRKNLQANWLNSLGGNPAPSPTPVLVDPTEYPRLAAYAYYRMVIIHIYLGEMDAAKVQYTTLQEKFPAGNPGHPYAEMATDFWNAYQSSGRMYDSCTAAIAYADKHPGILTPLGSNYHGDQSHTYVPADVCPFR